ACGEAAAALVLHRSKTMEQSAALTILPSGKPKVGVALAQLFKDVTLYDHDPGAGCAPLDESALHVVRAALVLEQDFLADELLSAHSRLVGIVEAARLEMKRVFLKLAIGVEGPDHGLVPVDHFL